MIPTNKSLSGEQVDREIGCAACLFAEAQRGQMQRLRKRKETPNSPNGECPDWIPRRHVSPRPSIFAPFELLEGYT